MHIDTEINPHCDIKWPIINLCGICKVMHPTLHFPQIYWKYEMHKSKSRVKLKIKKKHNEWITNICGLQDLPITNVIFIMTDCLLNDNEMRVRKNTGIEMVGEQYRSW